jgi:PAS domain-containing protein
VAQQSIEIILLRQWASYMAMPIWISGAEGELLYYNESAEALLGRRFEEAQEMPVEELPGLFNTTSVGGERIAAEDLPIGIAHRERRPAHRRVQIKGLDGVIRVLDITAFPLEAQGGSCLGTVAVFWEVEAS